MFILGQWKIGGFNALYLDLNFEIYLGGRRHEGQLLLYLNIVLFLFKYDAYVHVWHIAPHIEM